MGHDKLFWNCVTIRLALQKQTSYTDTSGTGHFIGITGGSLSGNLIVSVITIFSNNAYRFVSNESTGADKPIP